MLTQRNQQLSRYVFSKVIECLKQNIRKQVDCYLRTNNDNVYVCKIYLSGLIFWRERGEAYLYTGGVLTGFIHIETCKQKYKEVRGVLPIFVSAKLVFSYIKQARCNQYVSKTKNKNSLVSRNAGDEKNLYPVGHKFFFS